MAAVVEHRRRRVYLPAYAITDAARYAGTSPSTVRYWHYGGGALGPALPGNEHGKPLSYLQLIEVAVVATFRRLGVTLQKVRRARDHMAQMFHEEFPFTTFRLQTEGFHILLSLQQIEGDSDVERLLVADAYGQIGWQKLVSERFAEFDYTEDGLVITWHPAGRVSPVAIDPRVAFGAPTVRGIPTWVIKGRSFAGESTGEIQRDFGLKEAEVQAALEFEEWPMAA